MYKHISLYHCVYLYIYLNKLQERSNILAMCSVSVYSLSLLLVTVSYNYKIDAIVIDSVLG